MDLGYAAAADFAEHMAFKVEEKRLGDGALLWILAKAMRDNLVVPEDSGTADAAPEGCSDDEG